MELIDEEVTRQIVRAAYELLVARKGHVTVTPMARRTESREKIVFGGPHTAPKGEPQISTIELRCRERRYDHCDLDSFEDIVARRLASDLAVLLGLSKRSTGVPMVGVLREMHREEDSVFVWIAEAEPCTWPPAGAEQG